jgi:hypothetical protein
MKNYKLERLLKGETFITHEGGNSMSPILNSNQDHIIAPATWNDVFVDDIVYCKVRGNFYTHYVIAISEGRGCLIGNNKGKVNGWTKNVYGKVVQIL